MAHAEKPQRRAPDPQLSRLEPCFRANANLYLALARKCVHDDDVERAFLAYRDCLRTWRRANLLSAGKWSEDESEVAQEFADFLLGGDPEWGHSGDGRRLPLEC